MKLCTKAFVVLLFTSTFVKAMDDGPSALSDIEKKELILKEIFEKVAEGNDRISGGEPRAILLLGNTGSGKSTVAHVLTGRQLMGMLNDETGEMVIDAVSPLETIRISHNKTSETTIPNKIMANDTGTINKCFSEDGVVIWDCPGFNDTSLAQEIANSFYIKKVYKEHGKLKFILVVSEGSIAADKGTSFVGVLQQFCDSFNDIEKVKDSVSLVITGVHSRKKIEHLRNTLTKILNENESLSIESKKMLGYLIPKIALFHAPEKEEVLPENNLYTIISQMGTFADSSQDLGRFSLSDKAIEYSRELLKMSYNNLEHLVQILFETIQKPGSCMRSDTNTAPEKNYDLIKKWLPSQMNYVRVSEPRIIPRDERFITIKQIKELSLTAQKINNLKPEDLDAVTALAEKLYNIFEEFVIGGEYQCELTQLKEKIKHYAYAVRQMKDYCKLFGSLINHQYEEGFDLTSLSKKLFDVIKNANDILVNNLKQAVIHLEIDPHNPLVEYHEEALQILSWEQGNTECIKKQAQCNHFIGRTKKQLNQGDTAIAYLTKALKLDKTIVDAYDELGEIHEMLGEFEKAIDFYRVTENLISLERCFKNLIKKHPKDYKVYAKIGDTYSGLNMDQKALKYFMKAKGLSRDPEAIRALLNKMAECDQDNAESYREKAKSGLFYDFNLNL